ncbi:hypothetical protein [Pedobacter sp. MW01-1-1]|uniref:hypothetical protein n=1 Tax=Pedobacter sp. MW01-1-1 TaxID=3383027 RepID=UPI003FF076B0
MSVADRLNERKRGIGKITRLKDKKNKSFIIHYSCESFFNLDGRTPRVTSICVKNRFNGSVKTFSIHIHAQILKKDFHQLSDEDYDVVEKKMLKEFFSYIKSYPTYYWIHWNMRNSSYGFEAIGNRYRILGGNPKDLEDEFKIDLSDVLGEIYTFDFELHRPDGQLLNLCKRNRVSTRDALKRREEAEAFDKKEFLKLHMSTSRKVELIDSLLTLEEKGKLKVCSSKVKIYGLSPIGIFEMVRNNWILFLIWTIFIYILGVMLEPLVLKHLPRVLGLKL